MNFIRHVEHNNIFRNRRKLNQKRKINKKKIKRKTKISNDEHQINYN